MATKATRTRNVQTNKANYMSDEASADLKEALEDALAFERGERRDLNLTRIQGPARLKRHARLRSAKSETTPNRRAGALKNTSEV
jgi:hypothetical protein